MLALPELNSLGICDSDQEAIILLRDIAPFQDVSLVEVVPVLRDHVGTAEHRLEEKECEGSKRGKCLLFDEAQGGD